MSSIVYNTILSETTALRGCGLLNKEEVTAVLKIRYGSEFRSEAIEGAINAIYTIFEVPQVQASSSSIESESESETESDSKDKKQRKPRTLPDNEIRCCARVFYEKEHIESGKLRVIRPEDQLNRFGDRCKFKKTDGEYCKHHAEKQPFGVWNGVYGGKLLHHCEKYQRELRDEMIQRGFSF